MYHIYILHICNNIILMFFLPVSFLSKPLQKPNLELHCLTSLKPALYSLHTSRVPSGINNHYSTLSLHPSSPRKAHTAARLGVPEVLAEVSCAPVPTLQISHVLISDVSLGQIPRGRIIGAHWRWVFI